MPSINHLVIDFDFHTVKEANAELDKYIEKASKAKAAATIVAQLNSVKAATSAAKQGASDEDAYTRAIQRREKALSTLNVFMAKTYNEESLATRELVNLYHRATNERLSDDTKELNSSTNRLQTEIRLVRDRYAIEQALGKQALAVAQQNNALMQQGASGVVSGTGSRGLPVDFGNPTKGQINNLHEWFKELRTGNGTLGTFIATGTELYLVFRAFSTILNIIKMLGKGLYDATVEAENLVLVLSALSGSSSSGKALSGFIYDLTRHLPAASKALGDGAQALMGYGFSTGEVARVLPLLAQVTQGQSDKMQGLAIVYGQVRSQGRAYYDDIRQFVTAGIPVIETLSDVLHLPVEDIRKAVRDGKVDIGVFEEAMRTLTSEGGRYHDILQERLKGTSGQVQLLSNNFKMLLQQIGGTIPIKFVISVANNTVEGTSRLIFDSQFNTLWAAKSVGLAGADKSLADLVAKNPGFATDLSAMINSQMQSVFFKLSEGSANNNDVRSQRDTLRKLVQQAKVAVDPSLEGRPSWGWKGDTRGIQREEVYNKFLDATAKAEQIAKLKSDSTVYGPNAKSDALKDAATTMNAAFDAAIMALFDLGTTPDDPWVKALAKEKKARIAQGWVTSAATTPKVKSDAQFLKETMAELASDLKKNSAQKEIADALGNPFDLAATNITTLKKAMDALFEKDFTFKGSGVQQLLELAANNGVVLPNATQTYIDSFIGKQPAQERLQGRWGGSSRTDINSPWGMAPSETNTSAEERIALLDSIIKSDLLRTYQEMAHTVSYSDVRPGMKAFSTSAGDQKNKLDALDYKIDITLPAQKAWEEVFGKPVKDFKVAVTQFDQNVNKALSVPPQTYAEQMVQAVMSQKLARRDLDVAALRYEVAVAKDPDVASSDRALNEARGTVVRETEKARVAQAAVDAAVLANTKAKEAAKISTTAEAFVASTPIATQRKILADAKVSATNAAIEKNNAPVLMASPAVLTKAQRDSKEAFLDMSDEELQAEVNKYWNKDPIKNTPYGTTAVVERDRRRDVAAAREKAKQDKKDEEARQVQRNTALQEQLAKDLAEQRAAQAEQDALQSAADVAAASKVKQVPAGAPLPLADVTLLQKKADLAKLEEAKAKAAVVAAEENMRVASGDNVELAAADAALAKAQRLAQIADNSVKQLGVSSQGMLLRKRIDTANNNIVTLTESQGSQTEEQWGRTVGERRNELLDKAETALWPKERVAVTKELALLNAAISKNASANLMTQQQLLDLSKKQQAVEVERAKVAEDIKMSLISSAATAFVEGMKSIGAGSSTGLEDMATSLANMLPSLLLNAGLRLISIGDPASIGIGIGLVAASGLMNYVIGASGVPGKSATTAGTYYEANALGGVYGEYGRIAAFAKGGAFTNQVITEPTLFRFANGARMGLMGEAGEEAILPLTRRNGKLGVDASGTGSATIFQVIDQRSSGADVEQRETTDSKGTKILQAFIRDAVKKTVASGEQDGTFKRFGSSVVGVRRS